MGYQFNLFSIRLSISERNKAQFQFKVNAVIVCLNIQKKKVDIEKTLLGFLKGLAWIIKTSLSITYVFILPDAYF